MTPEQLKNSILQLAIEGKLVEQRKEEGTGEELFKEIQEEKQKLIEEGKLKKQKTLPEITEDEIPFDIPERWRWARLGEILYKLTDGTHSTPKYTLDGIPFISVKDLSSGYLNFESCKYIKSEEHKILFDRCNPEVGDILLTKVGTTGIPVIVDTDKEFSLFVSVALLKFNQMKLSNFFLKYLINSPLVQIQAKKNTRGVGNKNWVMKDIANTIIPLPPLAEQKRIVEKIEELLPLVDRYEKAWIGLEELNKKFPLDMQKSILQEAIQGKLVEQRKEEGTGEELFKDIQEEKQKLIAEGKLKKQKVLPEITEDEIPFDIPETWKWVRLGEIGVANIGLTYKPTEISNDGTIVLRSSNIKNGKLDFSDIVRVNKDISEAKMCRVGDILICARNGSKKLVGKAALINLEGMSFGAFMAIYRSICNEYVLHFINSTYFRNALLPETGTTTINQLTQDSLKSCVIPLPPFAEQKRIVEKIEELLPLCEKLK